MNATRLISVAVLAVGVFGFFVSYGFTQSPTDSKTDAKAEPKTDSKDAPKSDTKADEKADSKTDVKTAPKADAKADAKADLKADLEAAMGKVRTAIEKGDYDSFVRLVEPSIRMKKPGMSREQFQTAVSDPKSKEMFLSMAFPDLKTQTKFIKIKTLGDWAAYYAEDNLDDKNYLNVSMFIFHKVGGQWLKAGDGFGMTKARPGSDMAKKGLAAWKGPDEVLNTIDTYPKFQLENFVKEAESAHAAPASAKPSGSGTP